MPISFETYARVRMEDPEGKWELHCGRLVQRPPMTTEHQHIERTLAARLIRQLDPDEYEVGTETVRLRITDGSYYEPDVCVVPKAYVRRRLIEESRRFEVFTDPMPLVVEVWSPSTGAYDVDKKLLEYQWRRDAEIWRIHPYERMLTTWRLQPDGSYREAVITSGIVHPVALPSVAINLDELFEELT